MAIGNGGTGIRLDARGWLAWLGWFGRVGGCLFGVYGTDQRRLGS
jgi:hypothetical protein